MLLFAFFQPEVKKVTAIMSHLQEGKIRADYGWVLSSRNHVSDQSCFFMSLNFHIANNRDACLSVCLTTAANLVIHLSVQISDGLLWSCCRRCLNASLLLLYLFSFQVANIRIRCFSCFYLILMICNVLFGQYFLICTHSDSYKQPHYWLTCGKGADESFYRLHILHCLCTFASFRRWIGEHLLWVICVCFQPGRWCVWHSELSWILTEVWTPGGLSSQQTAS